MLLEALKEEMFQLEVEHKQGSISQQEYERARAALDQTLERAIKRVASHAQKCSRPGLDPRAQLTHLKLSAYHFRLTHSR